MQRLDDCTLHKLYCFCSIFGLACHVMLFLRLAPLRLRLVSQDISTYLTGNQCAAVLVCSCVGQVQGSHTSLKCVDLRNTCHNSESNFQSMSWSSELAMRLACVMLVQLLCESNASLDVSHLWIYRLIESHICKSLRLYRSTDNNGEP